MTPEKREEYKNIFSETRKAEIKRLNEMTPEEELEFWANAEERADTKIRRSSEMPEKSNTPFDI